MPGLAATTIQSGQCLAFPDTCYTPTPPAGEAPIPYPNEGMCNTAVEVAAKVMIMNMPAATLGSQIPLTQGDEAGVGGGIKSGVIMGPAKWSKGSSKVKFQGKPAVTVTGATTQNQNNANGFQIMTSQVLVQVAP